MKDQVFRVKTMSFLIFASLYCLITACAAPRKLLTIEKGQLISTKTKAMDNSLDEYRLKIDWQRGSTDIKIKLINDILCQKEMQDLHQKIGVYKAYDPISESDEINLTYQIDDLLIIRPFNCVFQILALKPLWNLKGFYESLFVTPLGYMATTHVDKIPMNGYFKSNGRISWEHCQSLPIKNNQVLVDFHQDINQKDYELMTNKEGELTLDLTDLPWLHTEAALKIEAAALVNGQAVDSSLTITPDELARLSLQKLPKAHQYYKLGKEYYEQNKLNEAIINFTTAIQFYPAYPEAHKDLGFAYAGIKDLSKALYHFKESLRINPSLKDADVLIEIIEAIEREVSR